MDVVSFDVAGPAASGSLAPAPAAPAAVPSAASGPSAPQTVDPQAPPAPHTTGDAGQSDTLHKLVSQFYGGGKSGANVAVKQSISVSFQVATDPNEIVTVFRDSDTNEVVAQFPPEIMVKIAEFFNKLSGATLDQKV